MKWSDLKYIVVLLVFCQSCHMMTESKATAASLSGAEGKEQEIILEILPATLHNDKNEAVYSITNLSDHEINLGCHFQIERFENGLWTEVPFMDDFGFPDVLYAVDKGGKEEYGLPISLAIEESHINEGRYRLSKEVWPLNNREDLHTLTVEFTIE